MDLFVGNSMWHLVRQSDLISQTVLVILFMMSVLCWTIFICKFILFRLRKRDLERVNQQLSMVRNLDDMTRLASQYHKTIPGQFISQTIIFLNDLVEARPQRVAQDYEILQYRIDQAVDKLMQNEESYLPVLSTAAAVSTLLGLFGTVWGLVHAFMSISEKQSADISVVAPGIAEALLTTLAGLIVAIPTLVMYNFLSIQVKRIEGQLTEIADKVSLFMQQLMIRG